MKESVAQEVSTPEEEPVKSAIFERNLAERESKLLVSKYDSMGLVVKVLAYSNQRSSDLVIKIILYTRKSIATPPNTNVSQGAWNYIATLCP